MTTLNKKTENSICVTISGKVWKGKKSSSIWMPEYFPNLYPGTLNLKLLHPKPDFRYTINVETKYGICYLKECLIDNLPGFIIMPPNGLRKSNLIEVASVYSLRQILNLRDKNIVHVKIIM